MLTLFAIALFVLLYDLRWRSAPTPERVAEALTIFLFAYAVLAALLTPVQRYDHWLVASLLVGGMAGVALLGRRGPVGDLPETGGDARWFALVGIVFVAFAAGPFEFVSMGADAGVYCNYAKNLERTGGAAYHLDMFGGGLGRRLAISNTGLGIYCTDRERCYYQFFPGWPSILALGMHVFGPLDYRWILLLVGTLLVFWCFRILRGWLQGWPLVAASVCMALNPVLVYFAKYTTSELFLALCVVFAVHAFLRGTPRGRTLALFAAGAFTVSHISSFTSLPLLVTYGAFTARHAGRAEVRRFSAATGIFLAGLGLGYVFSPQYYVDIFAKFGAALGHPVPFYVLPALAAAGAAASWAWVVRRAAAGSGSDV